jgi:hypothetical protein
MSKITIFNLLVSTVSEGNCSQNPFVKNARHSKQKWHVRTAFKNNNLNFKLPVEVTLTRISSRKLDEHDNLRMSMKWIADQIAAELTGDRRPGRADDSKEISWKYDQRKGKIRENIVEVKIEEL